MADSRSPVVQPCARCGARWAVQGKPLHWCPRCHGVLLSPAPVDAPPERRNYRWVARPPGRKGHPDRTSPRRAANPETPRYTGIPRWGLQDRPAQPVTAPQGRLERLATRIPLLLTLTAAVFGVAALAELLRYGILLRNRTRLIHPWLLWGSDAAVIFSAVLGLLLALVAALALVAWLTATRRAAYADAGKRDPRSPRALALGCLVPGVNLVLPGVFLTEAARLRGADRLLRVVRIWWSAWVLNGAVVVIALLYKCAGSLQVEADGVLFTVVTDLIAAAVAALTLWVVRAFAGRDLRGRELAVKRWLIAPAGAEPVIEPVQPGAAADASGSAGRAPAAAVGNDELGALNPDAAPANSGGAPDREQEEVLAK